MALSRTVLMVCLLAVLSIDRTAANTEISASIGENVLLPCHCSNTTVQVVWQFGWEDDVVVVNHYKAASNKTNEPDDLYKKRSCFKLNITEGDCSLLLINVSESDLRSFFSCFTFNKYDESAEHHVYLRQRRIGDSTGGSSHDQLLCPRLEMNDPRTGENVQTTVGASLSLVAVIITVLSFIIIGILLMRSRRQRMQRTENRLDPQSGLPILNHSPV